MDEEVLATVDVKGVQIVGEQIGHFVVHPAITRDTASGEFFLSADTWVIHHLPSRTDLMMLHEADPVEWPGHPLAIDMEVVRDFLEWLDQFADWSAEQPKPAFAAESDKQAYRQFGAGPVFWRRPQPTDETLSKQLGHAPATRQSEDQDAEGDPKCR
ncbi:hypothetical protein ACNQR7_32145 [Mycolicibacterium senegalense]|uniref:hypothetical protein n=1 Tax=Mycolicibacterium senegalense TaxID=1796 RepID=UPI003AAE6C3C